MATEAPLEQSRPSRPYFPVLDGVRACAALMVMLFHFDQQWSHHAFAIFGQTGVDLFFVLSGFLITTILLQANPGDWHEVRNFFVRRVLRIFPLYYGFLLVTLLLGNAVTWYYWFYLQNIVEGLGAPLTNPAHFWSLGVEEQFYLVWPFLVLFLPRKRLPWLMAGLIALSICLRIYFVGSTIDVFRFPLTRMDGLAAGSLLAYIFWKRWLQQAVPYLWALGACSLVLLAAEFWVAHHWKVNWTEVPKYAVSAALYTSVTGLLVASSGSPVHRLLQTKFFRSIGQVSYGMYVFHPAVFTWLTPRLGQLPLVVKELLCFVSVFVLASLSYRLYERPFINMKQRLAPEAPFRKVRQESPLTTIA